MTTRKILFSPGFGGGWSSKHGGDISKFMLTYQPLIDAIERGETVWAEADEDNYSSSIRKGTAFSPSHPAVRSFVEECEERFGETPYLGGARTLAVETINGPFRIDARGGSESVIEGWPDYLDLDDLP